jgi:hypothetical protein
LVRMPSTKSGLALPILASTIYLVDTIFSTAQHRRKTVLTGRLPSSAQQRASQSSMLPG